VADSFANWLALREPADLSARDAASESLSELQLFLRAVCHGADGARSVRVLDLATGTGSNFRYLASRLGHNQEWLLVDHDPVLLTEAPVRIAAWGAAHNYRISTDRSRIVLEADGSVISAETRCLDLGAAEASLDIFAGRHLVTASALLDLVSDRWLRPLAAHCRENNAAALFSLSYNGTSRCTPVEPEDRLVLQLFNRHQARDKGLGGPAAGPDAVNCAQRAFVAVGYELRRRQSDWLLRPEQRGLQRQLIDGWAEAAIEVAPEAGEMIRSWLLRRLEHVRVGRSHVIVGHDDLLAWPSSSPVGSFRKVSSAHWNPPLPSFDWRDETTIGSSAPCGRLRAT
jgi:hypothetical protein